MRSGFVLGNHSESVSNKLGRSWLRAGFFELLLAATDIGVGGGCHGRQISRVLVCDEDFGPEWSKFSSNLMSRKVGRK